MAGDIDLFDSLKAGLQSSERFQKTVWATKTLEAEGSYTADDVISNSDTNGVGTAWEWDFEDSGEITGCLVVHATTGIEPRIDIQLYSKYPTCELDDNTEGTGPVTADVPYYLGTIENAALKDIGTAGLSHRTTTTSTVGGLPISHWCKKIYGVVMTRTTVDFLDDTLLSIGLVSRRDR